MAQVLQILAVITLMGGIAASLWLMAASRTSALSSIGLALGVCTLLAVSLFALASLLTWVYNIMLHMQHGWRTGK